MRGDALDAECRLFARYLADLEAPADVLAAYRQAHDVSPVEVSRVSPALDRSLLTISRWGPGFARGADAYAAICARGSTLRRKLVLLVAILEARGETSAALDSARAGSRALWCVELAARVAIVAAMGAAVTVVLVPVYLWHRSVDVSGR